MRWILITFVINADTAGDIKTLIQMEQNREKIDKFL